MKRFGKTGVWLWGVANGLERIAVNEKAMRSISVEHTFDKDVADKQEVVAKIVELSDRLHKRVLSSKTSFRVVGIKIRFTHFQTYTRENTLSSTTSSREELLREAKNLFREFEKSPRKVRLIGLFVSSLSESETNENLESWVQ